MYLAAYRLFSAEHMTYLAQTSLKYLRLSLSKAYPQLKT